MIDTRLELALVRAAAMPVAVFGALYQKPAFDAVSGANTITQRVSIRIRATPDAVYGLLDPGSALSRWTIRGESLTGVSPRIFHLESAMLPGQILRLEEREAQRPFRISHRCSMADGSLLALATCSTSAYDIRPYKDQWSEIDLAETTEFIAEAPRAALTQHALLMRLSMRMDLLRLKYEAETGRDTDARRKPL